MNDNDTSFAVVRNDDGIGTGYYFIALNRHAQEWNTKTGFRTVAQELTHEQAIALRDLLDASE